MSPAAWLAAFSFVYVGALGLILPYFALYLQGEGLTPGEITRVLALGPLMALVGPLVAGRLADARRARAWLLRAATGGTAFAFAALLRGGLGRAAIYSTVGVFALFRSPIHSLWDASALDHVRGRGGSYGALRLWGSVGFLLAALGGGAALERVGLLGVQRGAVGALGLAALSAWWIPAPPPRVQPGAARAWRRLISARGLGWFLLAIAGGQLAAAAYDGCFSLHLRQLGHGGAFIGLAWAIGVVAEVAVMAGAHAVFRRVPPAAALALALGVAALRWAILPLLDGRAILLAQPLHGITFGLFYVAGVTTMRERADPEAASAAQGLFAAALALGSVLGLWLAGRTYAALGAAGLFRGAAVVAGVAALAALAHLRRQPLRVAAEQGPRRPEPPPRGELG